MEKSGKNRESSEMENEVWRRSWEEGSFKQGADGVLFFPHVLRQVGVAGRVAALTGDNLWKE